MNHSTIPAGTIQPIRKQRLAIRIADALRRYVVEQQLQPGDRLPPERDLAAAFAVSRNVIREALSALEHEGLISSNHGQGTFVRTHPVLPEPPSVAPDTSAANAAEVLEARATFEAGLAELIVARTTSEDLERLEAIVGRMAQSVREGRPAGVEDVAFHEQLLRCTHNAEIVRIGQSIVLRDLHDRLVQHSGRSLLGTPEGIQVENHARIVAAIKNRDAVRLRQLLVRHAYGRGDETTDKT